VIVLSFELAGIAFLQTKLLLRLAYKNVDDVVEVVHQAQIARKVARLKPYVVIKG